jgi:mannose-6-phosphate isomerase-like protein (cupin superfamily)
MAELPYRVEKPWGYELVWALRTQTNDETVSRPFKAGESVHIPPGLIHQIEAIEDSDVLEASTPELDDLVRLEDRYGRLL